jgi:hypothetical protein
MTNHLCGYAYPIGYAEMVGLQVWVPTSEHDSLLDEIRDCLIQINYRYVPM